MLPAIPYHDLRSSGLSGLWPARTESARALLKKSAGAFGLASRIASLPALPIGDALSLRWLEKTGNPYLGEIEHAAREIGHAGVYALNVCYEWGCTSGAYNSGEYVQLTRVLDWPFPALGEHMVVARLSGSAGDYYAATWPGVSGIYQALAKGRFAVALNQAPMRRHRTGIFIDWARNRFRLWHENALPPSHLLRQVCEIATDYAEACRMLSEIPVALPVIFIVTGTQAGEGCVIERLERDALVRPLKDGQSICAANHFESRFNGIGHGWMPRAVASDARSAHAKICGTGENFSWLAAPVSNALSRLAYRADAGQGIFELVGLSGVQEVTQRFRLDAAA